MLTVDIAARISATAIIEICAVVNDRLLLPVNAISLRHLPQTVVPEVLLESQPTVGAVESVSNGRLLRTRHFFGVRAVDSSNVFERRDRITKRLPWVVLVLPVLAQYAALGVNLALVLVCGTSNAPRGNVRKFAWRAMGTETRVGSRTASS